MRPRGRRIQPTMPNSCSFFDLAAKRKSFPRVLNDTVMSRVPISCEEKRCRKYSVSMEQSHCDVLGTEQGYNN